MSLADRLALVILTLAVLAGGYFYVSALRAGDAHTQAVFACVGDRAPTREVLAECAPTP